MTIECYVRERRNMSSIYTKEVEPGEPLVAGASIVTLDHKCSHYIIL